MLGPLVKLVVEEAPVEIAPAMSLRNAPWMTLIRALTQLGHNAGI